MSGDDRSPRSLAYVAATALVATVGGVVLAGIVGIALGPPWPVGAVVALVGAALAYRVVDDVDHDRSFARAFTALAVLSVLSLGAGLLASLPVRGSSPDGGGIAMVYVFVALAFGGIGLVGCLVSVPCALGFWVRSRTRTRTRSSRSD